MNAIAMLFPIPIPDWNSLDSVRHAHNLLEAAALVFFALLVLFEVLAHFSEDKERERLLEKMGLCFFAVAVFAEIAAYPCGQRNDALSEQVIGSLDVKARDAAVNAATALSDSKEAETKSSKALDEAGDALSKSDKSLASATHASELAEETSTIEENRKARRLSVRQISEIGQALQKFAGRGAYFVYPQGDEEAANFMGDIKSAVGEAQWHILGSQSQIVMGSSGPEPSPSQPLPIVRPRMGVLIVYKPAWLNPTEQRERTDVVRALVCELSKRGFDTGGGPDPLGMVSDILVRVEHRPEGPQGDAKLKHEKKSKKQVNCE